jgi:Fanconi anemia group M protein
LGALDGGRNGAASLGGRRQQYVSMSLIKRDSLARRKYQEDIFEACKDANSLVVLPTGLGKTVIAAMLAAHRLLIYPTSKVVFLAPTKPLVRQHRNTFQRILDLNYEEMCFLTGEKKAKVRASLWRKGRAVFATPQVLAIDLSKGRYDLRNVSLIIFDEAHRATGSYAYVGIAKEYFKQAIYPRTIGLTASPGWSQEEISEIKRNLRLESIEARTETSMDVIEFVQPLNIQWIRVQLGQELTDLGKLLDEMMNERLGTLVEYGLVSQEDLHWRSRRDMVELLSELGGQTRKGPTATPMAFYQGLTLSAQVIRLSYCEEFLNTQGLRALCNYMDRLVLQSKSSRSSNALRGLAGDARFAVVIDTARKLLDRGVKHPKLTELVRILKEQVDGKPSSRILVFAQLRDTVEEIVEELRSQGISASLFVGQKRGKGFTGMTQVKQVNVLRGFKDGLYSALVATSVGEEGLDIAECDLVVMYDAVPSEVRYIQRRGRVSRHHEGKVVTLIAAGTQDERYYLSAISKEKKMRDTISRVKEKETMKIEDFMLGLPDMDNENRESSKKESNEFKNEKGEPGSGNSLPQEGCPFTIETTDQPRTVIADRGMERSQLCVKLKERGLNPIIRSTTAADFIVGDDVGVIYITQGTLGENRIASERLHQKIVLLKEIFPVPFVIYNANGCTKKNANQEVYNNSLCMMIAYFTVVERVNFVEVQSEEEACSLINSIARVAF